MVTKPIATKMWIKIAGAPRGWIQSKEGKELCAKAVKVVLEKEGKEEAEILKNLITTASVL